MNLRFSTKLILLTTFLVVFSVSVSTITAYYYKRKSLEQALANELLGIVNSVSTFIDGEQHSLIAYDEFLGEIDNEAYLLKLHDQLNHVERNNPKITNPGHSAIYTLRVAGEFQGITHLAFVATSQLNEENTFDLLNTIKAEDFHLEALKGKSVTRGLYEDDHGIWISACAPITIEIPNGDDPTLQVVGLVQADYNVQSFHSEVRDQTAALIGGAIAGVILAAILSIWFERKLAKPLKELSLAASRIGDGDLETEVRVETKDEFGDLADSFNQMVVGLKERNLVKSTLKRYVAPDVVDYLLENPDAMDKVGERRYLTILFSDLKGFTNLSQRHDPRSIIQLLNTYLGAVSECIGNRSGTLDKYMGDGVMAFFGAPKPRMDHPLCAAQAALDHVKVLETIREQHRDEGWPHLEVRVGLHSGDMIVGNIGGEGNQDYTVIGDAVNVGSRLEAANKIYGTQILCSEQTWEHCRDSMVCREIDTLSLMGRKEPVRIFEILRSNDIQQDSLETSKTNQIIETYESGLAAYREAEFAKALERFEKVLHLDADDEPSKVMIKRCQTFLENPPPKNWNGTWHQSEK